MKPLKVEGAWVHEPRVFADHRGSFHEWFAGADFRRAVGRHLGLAQANCSVSRPGVLRGIHFADVPPGQAKYVTCVRGAVLDVVADIRTGSPTFGQWEAVRLDDESHRCVYLSEGLGHAFLALASESTVVYLCSEGYTPRAEHGVHPLDTTLGIDWPVDRDLLLSDKDAAAPTLAEAARGGLLPSYEACRALRSASRNEGNASARA
ncbi:dTDP-4-dehydrorhamnose 3,5-epimerase [Streptomyces sp. NBC_01007]|nr:dTDP-4-dehydrorhamnose 3,5-epimerase [Streptomyces sp. NBC_01007]